MVTLRVKVNNLASGQLNGDAVGCYPFIVAEALNAEFAVFGWGSQGWEIAGTGGVPTFPNAYNYIKASQPIIWSTHPDYIFINQGTNDSLSTTGILQSDFNSVVNGLRSVAPNAVIFIILPFG